MFWYALLSLLEDTLADVCDQLAGYEYGRGFW
jgi:hypothetical protein